MALTNNAKVPLSMAVFLAIDNYDYESDTVSTTALLKPLRQTILTRRVPDDQKSVDIADLVNSRMGTAIHDGIERAWLENYERGMRALGFPDETIKRVVINPDPNNLPAGCIPVYMEKRSYRDFMGFRISGKFDFVGAGALEDFKSTSTFSYMSGTKDWDYVMQGSIYRWLNPDIITDPNMSIQFIFTDWQSFQAKQNPKYPQTRTITRRYQLFSLEETEAYIAQRLKDYMQFKDAAQEDLPLCSSKELWMSDPTWKYYKDPNKKTRSTKNFDNQAEAMDYFAKTGGVGELVEIPGMAKACAYCAAFPICTQKDALIRAGQLKL